MDSRKLLVLKVMLKLRCRIKAKKPELTMARASHLHAAFIRGTPLQPRGALLEETFFAAHCKK